ncbi:helix-turn-helix transcriptional regulator [Mammaliicoccus sp. A-M2]|uniref:helix-turn-helix domain-containing protein n=1 Tax=Mammaliicoccus sp. A-M2 TaxID=2898662 RepID=UPI001EFB0EF1|nr:helix-turn-helix transcriptional regulator [Mammaliicoccus sp. A-M2]
MKNNFRILLAERKTNVAKVCDKTGISKTTLYGLYHENTQNPDFKTIMKLCDYLGITPNEFLGINKSVNDYMK